MDSVKLRLPLLPWSPLGNFNTITPRNFGHIAAAIVAVINSALILVIAWLLGRAFDGMVPAIVIGYFACCAGAVGLILFLDRSKPWQSRISTTTKRHNIKYVLVKIFK